MSYDLMIFEADVPPADHQGFLNWFRATIRLQEGHLSGHPDVASDLVQTWYRDMARAFPHSLAPDAPANIPEEDDRWTEYRFASHAVFARFRWEASQHAYRKALKIARNLRLGFFDVSGDEAAVWAPFGHGRYGVIHRGEKLEPASAA